jgi:uncharacterized lipoprotein
MPYSSLKPVALVLLALSLAGCTSVFVRSDDSQCARDLAEVERAAEAARQALAQGVSAEDRQPMLDLMVDSADHARASCGYERPDTPSSDRARKPKAG